MKHVALFLFSALLILPLAQAQGHESANEDHALAPEPKAEAKPGKVAAVDTKKAAPIRFNELIQTNGNTQSFVDNENTRVELAPHSVAEFREGEGFHLLRGSAYMVSKAESSVRTTSATVNFAGEMVISYDHKERTTSAFVLEGQARMINSGEESQSLRLDRFRGATMVVGDVIPQLIRQLDVGSLDSWLKGYAWPDATRSQWLSGVPDGSLAVKTEIAPHLEDVKLENYFSAIDADDEVAAPDYYEKKFADPDKTIAEANSVKVVSKNLKPEEAALISLPSTKIDLGFNLPPQVLTVKQKQQEVVYIEPKKAERSLASLKHPVKAKKTVVSEQGDPDISSVLNRLRNIQAQETVVSPQMELKTSSVHNRGPASVGVEAVPDSVYDYSQNF